MMHRCVTTTLTVAAACAFLNTGWGDSSNPPSNVHSYYAQTRFNSLGELALEFELQRDKWLPMYPPGLQAFTVDLDPTPALFAPNGFPDAFVDGLVGVVRDGIVMYPVTILEDVPSGKRFYLNQKGDVLAILPPPEGYDAEEAVRAIHGEPPGSMAGEELQMWYSARHPARLAVQCDLILNAELADLLARDPEPPGHEPDDPGGGIIMMRYDGPPVDDLCFKAVERVTNGVMLTIVYPGSYTNGLEVFVCDDLVKGWWFAHATTNYDSGTNWVEWVDTNTNLAHRFYAVGNADLDTDNDGLTDARELYVYNSSPTNTDTDADGWGDYDEITIHDTDPTIANTNKPVVTIVFPESGTTKVWIP